MCAECHSTNLRKNYDLAADAYDTTWSEINVSCESCHGPGSNHVTWAGVKRGSKTDSDANGLVVHLRPLSGSWVLEESSPKTLHWKGQTRTRTELETCAPCHSRRHPITSNYQPGQPFADSYVPSLLDSGVYYADGQILEEDYEYGSFLQSKMHRLGVTCSDCHNPHSLKLPSANLNSVCGGCHLPEKFNTPEHHHHKAESAGAAVRQLPYAVENLHGGGCAARPQFPRTASGLLGGLRNTQRLHPVPQRPGRHSGPPTRLRSGMVQTAGRRHNLSGRLTRADAAWQGRRERWPHWPPTSRSRALRAQLDYLCLRNT